MKKLFNFFKKQNISKEDIELMELFDKFYLYIADLLNNVRNDVKTSEKNTIIQKVYEKKGYADVPKLFSNEQKIEGIKVYRGISAKDNQTLKSYIKQFLEGELYLGGRASIYGLGIYTYYGDNRELLDNYASSGGIENIGEILEIIIPNNCKIIDISKLTKLQDYFFDMYTNYFKEKHKDDKKYNFYIEQLLSNLGCFATALGYDVINVEDKKYMVILNRSKIIVNNNNFCFEKNNSR